MKKFGVLGVFILGLLSAGCTTTASQQVEEPVRFSDPLENINRFFFSLNQRLDRNAGRPAATAYKDTVPQSVRSGLHNVLDNLGGPVTVANSLLQVRLKDAGIATGRFVTHRADERSVPYAFGVQPTEHGMMLTYTYVFR